MANRVHTVKARMTDDELERLDALRSATGLSRADQLRHSTLGADAAAKQAHARELAGIEFELAKVGTNINQLAHWANTHHELPALDQLAEVAKLVSRALEAVRK
jgi:hypothetical protein